MDSAAKTHEAEALETESKQKMRGLITMDKEKQIGNGKKILYLGAGLVIAAGLITGVLLAVFSGPSPQNQAEKNALTAAKRLVKNGNELEQQVRFNEALENNYLAVAAFYIKNGIRIPDGSLSKMAAAGNIEMLELLHKNGASDLDDALITAAAVGQIKSIEYLLKIGAKEKDRALLTAVAAEKKQAGEFLLKHGARPCMQVKEDKKNWHYSVKNGVCISSFNIEGKSCLYFAVAHNDLDLAEKLIKAGALNYSDALSLPLAVKQFNRPMIKLLIENGASAKNISLLDPFEKIISDKDVNYAYPIGNPRMDSEILQLLIKGGLDINQKNHKGHPLISVPINRIVLQCLLNAGAVPKTDAKDERLLEIPFNEITDDAALEWIKILVKAGANLYVNNGIPPYCDRYHPDLLYIAAKYGFIKTAKFLISNKLVVHPTSFLIAVKTGHNDIVKLMCSYIIDRHLPDIFKGLEDPFFLEYRTDSLCSHCSWLIALAQICDQNPDFSKRMILNSSFYQKNLLLRGAVLAEKKDLVRNLLKAGAKTSGYQEICLPKKAIRAQSGQQHNPFFGPITDYADKYCSNDDILILLGLKSEESVRLGLKPEKMAKPGDLTAEPGSGNAVIMAYDKIVLLPHEGETVDRYRIRFAKLKKEDSRYLAYDDEKAKPIIKKRKAQIAKDQN